MRKILLIWAVLAATILTSTRAQDSLLTRVVQQDSLRSHLRISLVTCGPGTDEVYEVFGHTAVRITDSLNGTDLAYNYGTFDGFDKDFEWKFMRGKLAYCLSVAPFAEFANEYVALKRSVSEQVLHLTDKQKNDIRNFLDWNAEPANREYKYDFFFDNCATRIRDIFPHTITGFTYPNVLPPHQLTFRDIINDYFIPKPWERLGVNILLGSKIDKVMTNADIMFLPDYLQLGLASATANGSKIASPSEVLIPSQQGPLPHSQAPLYLTVGILLVTVLVNSLKPLKVVARVFNSFILLVTGFLGCLILVMWFGTDHQACRNNFNLLWALPTNLFIAVANPKGKPRYVIAALLLLLVSILIHVLKIQAMLFPEMVPLLAALAYIYGTIYYRTRKKIAP